MPLGKGIILNLLIFGLGIQRPNVQVNVRGRFTSQYGPQVAPLVPPNNDVGVDGIVINLASLLAVTATIPFGNGYYQGDANAPLEAASACPGVYGKGAYPGYPGDLLVDSTTGASYNAYGTNGRKYLVPAMYNHRLQHFPLWSN